MNTLRVKALNNEFRCKIPKNQQKSTVKICVSGKKEAVKTVKIEIRQGDKSGKILHHDVYTPNAEGYIFVPMGVNDEYQLPLRKSESFMLAIMKNRKRNARIKN